MHSEDHAPRTVVLDSNAVDVIADTPGLLDEVRSAIDDGFLRLVVTHITYDELAAIGDPVRRTRMLAVAEAIGQVVPTGAFVLGTSRLGQARLGDRDFFEAYRQDNLKHTNDALNSITAEVDGAAVCTRDKTMRSRALARGLECVDPADLPSWARGRGDS